MQILISMMQLFSFTYFNIIRQYQQFKMNTISPCSQLTGEQFELGNLLMTNKSLASEKRQVHQQKLRVYSQKSVKIKEMLRQAQDSQSRNCLQHKLQVLKEKQNNQIAKLAKIQQIQKEIDQFITQESQQEIVENKNNINKLNRNKNNAIIDKLNQIQNTPAQRLKAKSSYNQRNMFAEKSNQNALEQSLKNKSFNRKKSGVYQTNQWLAESQSALEQMNSNKIVSKNFQRSGKNSKNDIILLDEESKGKRSNSKSKSNNSNKLQQFDQRFSTISKQLSKLKIKTTVPDQLQELVQKVEEFSPSNLTVLLEYIQQSQIVRKQLKQKQIIDRQGMKEEEQKLKNIIIERSQEEKRIYQIQDRIANLIEDQRQLMEKIDNFQKEENQLNKRICSAVNSIIKSKQIITDSTFASNHQIHQQIQKNKDLKLHKVSIDSFQSYGSCSDNGNALSHELNIFERLLQQFLLSAEREAMLAGGQIQQITLRLSRAKDELTNCENKKKSCEAQLLKLDQILQNKKQIIDGMEDNFKKVEQEINQYDSVTNLKRTLINQLQDKCQRLKGKKKTLSEKVKKAEDVISNISAETTDKQLQLNRVKAELQRLIKQKQVFEAAMIFNQREQLKKSKELETITTTMEQVLVQIQQNTKINEQLIRQIKQNEVIIQKQNQNIQKMQKQQNSKSEKIKLIQKQIYESSNELQNRKQLLKQQNDLLLQNQQKSKQLELRLSFLNQSINSQQQQKSNLKQLIKKHQHQCQQYKLQVNQIRSTKQDLQQILHEVIQKKQDLLSEVDQKSKDLEMLLDDLQNGQEDINQINKCLASLDQSLGKKEEDINHMDIKINSLKQELDQLIEEESNVLQRIGKLRETQKYILIESGIKGISKYLQGDIKQRVCQAVNELNELNNIKIQLKQCKYQNRKLRLDNQRMLKLLQQGATQSK